MSFWERLMRIVNTPLLWIVALVIVLLSRIVPLVELIIVLPILGLIHLFESAINLYKKIKRKFYEPR